MFFFLNNSQNEGVIQISGLVTCCNLKTFNWKRKDEDIKPLITLSIICSISFRLFRIKRTLCFFWKVVKRLNSSRSIRWMFSGFFSPRKSIPNIHFLISDLLPNIPHHFVFVHGKQIILSRFCLRFIILKNNRHEDEGRKEFPVVVVLHGGNSSLLTWSWTDYAAQGLEGQTLFEQSRVTWPRPAERW